MTARMSLQNYLLANLLRTVGLIAMSEVFAGRSKRPASKAAANEGPRRTLGVC